MARALNYRKMNCPTKQDFIHKGQTMKLVKRIAVVGVGLSMVFQSLAPATTALATVMQNESEYEQARQQFVEANAVAAYAEDDSASSDQDNGTATDTGDQGGNDNSGSQDATADDSASADQSGTETTPDSPDANGSASDDNQDDATDSSEADDQAADDGVAVQADEKYPYDDLDQLKKAAGDLITIADNTITMNKDEGYILLSHTNPSAYQTAIIKSSSASSNINLTGTATATDGKTFEFIGLGSEAIPFKGTLDSSRAYATKRALFAGLVPEKTNNIKVSLTTGFDANSNIFADYLGPSETGASELTVEVTPVAEINVTSPLLGTVAGTTSLDVSYKNASSASFNISVSNNNAGLIAREIASGASLKIESVSGIAASTNVTSGNNNAGLLVGELKNDATFETCGFGSGTSLVQFNGTISAPQGAAGGLVGKANEGASVKITSDEVDLESLKVQGVYSGGFIGKAEKLVLDNSFLGGKTFKLPGSIGEKDHTEYAGGFIGKASFKSNFELSGDGGLKFPDTVILCGKPGTNNGHADGAGAVFGQLDLCSNVTIKEFKSVKSELNGIKDQESGRITYGGLVGRVRPLGNSTTACTLTMQDVTAETSNGNKAWYYGGLAGWVGTGNNAGTLGRTVLIVRDAKAIVSSGSPGRSFGGAVGCLDGSGTLDLGSFKLASTAKTEIAGGTGTDNYAGGVIGEVWRNAVAQLSGVTDLSEATFKSADHVGQIAGSIAYGLVYAKGSGQNATSADEGWTLKRGAAVELDDIATYGEVVRLSGGLSPNLLSLDSNYKLQFSGMLAKQGDAYVLASADDFAKYAITFQTRGSISGIEGLDNNGFVTSGDTVTKDTNWQQLSSTNIKIKNDIDLRKTGIQGLTRDAASPKWAGTTPTLSGNVDGEKADGTVSKVTLAIGESYGVRVKDGKDEEITSADTSEGNGKIYRHNRLGLFNSITGNVSNLELAGSMNFLAKMSVDAGPLSAYLGNGATTTLENVISAVTMAYAPNGDNGMVYAGGLIGRADGGAKSLVFDPGNKVVLDMTVSAKGDKIIAGGALGLVDGDGAINIAVNQGGLEVGGRLIVKAINDGKQNDGVATGGFIGAIFGGAHKKTVTLSGLLVNELTLAAPQTWFTGGVLGTDWINTDVKFTGSSEGWGVTVENSTLKSVDDNKSLFRVGGLIYRASGKWTVNKYGVNYKSYQIKNVKEDLGLLVCRGGADNNNIGTRQNCWDKGLYLETTAQWESVFKVNSDIIDTSNGPDSFDEWVNSTWANYKEVSDSETNNILKSGVNGVVSLHTSGGKIVMDGVKANCNTYINRTDYGKTKTLNAKTRYYYNLDGVKDEVGKDANNNDGRIDTADELMLWSAIWYADPTLREYLTVSGTDCSSETSKNLIGSASDKNPTNFDMEGYSYYPVDISMSLTIENASFKLYRSEFDNTVDGTEAESKKAASTQTQHRGMHGGLLHDFSAASGSAALSVSNVSFAGTVGRVDDTKVNSGALICGTATGSLGSNGDRNMCTIAIDGLTLDGIRVVDCSQNDNDRNNADAYSPLLINRMDSYINLSVSGVSCSEKQKNIITRENLYAATSLMGDLGVVTTKDGVSSTSSTQITASFKNIDLPSKASKGTSMFLKASLLNRFAYKELGSASYNFYKNDEKITYGAEIDRGGTEYSGKQLWYFDEDGYGEDSNLVVVPGTDLVANLEEGYFKSYLPYVSIAEKDTFNHEIKVNQRLEDLTTGCGTYADPYVISKSDKLTTLAKYINMGDPTDGWQITIAKNQGKECKRLASIPDQSNEVTYKYYADRKLWVSGDAATLSDTTMRRYVSSCYIDIRGVDGNGDVVDEGGRLSVNTSSFDGIGSVTNPFRGVITSTTGATLKVDAGSGAYYGLVKYSYGSVVKNLSIEYDGKYSISFVAKEASHNAPGSFFGGVIGSILGGDNIIDDVTVTSGSSFEVSTSGTIKDKDNKDVEANALVPVGGYVGTIVGGGVIFRGANTNWYAGSTSDCYNNPIVGRVLDGYAFNEGTDAIGDNTVPVTDGTKVCNYKVNQVTPEKDLITTGELNSGGPTTTTVKNSKGLLVLSAIINSGAAAGSRDCGDSSFIAGKGYTYGTNAYCGKVTASSEDDTSQYSFGNGDYGKVRNAAYGAIGKPDDSEAATDFDLSVADDTRTPGISGDVSADNLNEVNAPYLVTQYCSNKTTMFICGAGYNAMDLVFNAGANYDMSGYGNGYRGLSTQYYTNALMDSFSGGTITYSRDRGIPWIAHIQGNGAEINVSVNVAEYSHDEFNVVGVGGLFSYVVFTQNGVEDDDSAISGLTIAGSVRHDGGASNSDRGVGALAGVVSASDSLKKRIKIKDVAVKKEASAEKITISGPATAGGLFGNSGKYWRVAPNPTKPGTFEENGTGMLTPVVNNTSVCYKTPEAFDFVDCSYCDLALSAGTYAGGYIGQIKGEAASLTNSVTASGESDKIVAQNSTISFSSFASAGGLVGTSSAPLSIGNDGKNEGATKIKISGVDISSTVGRDGYKKYTPIGGVVGSISKQFKAYNVEVVGVEKNGNKTTFQSKNEDVGGLVGLLQDRGNATIDDCTVKDVQIKSCAGSGGVIGQTRTVDIVASNILVNNVTVEGGWSGGFFGTCLPGGGGGSVSVSNAIFRNNSFTASSGNSGGFSGDMRTNIQLNNVLMDGNIFYGPGSQGVLVGNASGESNSLYCLKAVGLEVRCPDGANQQPSQLIYGTDSNMKTANKKSFISFANYDGDAAEKAADATLFDGVEDAEPWVTTSPQTSTKLDSGYLYGDGAELSNDKTYGKLISRIVNGSKDKAANAYAYTNTAGHSADGDAQALESALAASLVNHVSTYGENNEDAPDEMKNYGVLQVSGGDEDAITAYVNAVTNGGFADAVKLGNNYVSVVCSVYQLSGATKNDKGVYVGGSLKELDGATPNVTYAGDSKFSISSRFDNGENKLTLIKVTFSADGRANDKSDAMTHVVLIPVIVRRQLETTVTTTFDHGTTFTEQNYIERPDSSRLLESFGSSATALITFQYNKKLNETTEYGWDSYLASGGSMGAVNKTLYFDSNGVDLPKGTVLMLVDKDNGDHTYKLKLTEKTSRVSLSDFEDTEDSNKQYQPKWLSELMNISASESDGGAWVKLSGSGNATAKAKLDGKWEYFRPYTSADKDEQRYKLACDAVDKKEPTPSENFYLVVYIPQSKDEDAPAAINGSLKTIVTCDGVKIGSINYALRQTGEKDGQSNTPSTYNFVAAYGQTLSDVSLSAEAENGSPKTPDDAEGAGKVLHMDVVDAVTADKEQLYTENDPMYYKLDASLVTHTEDGDSGSAFPTGVSGDLKFYVYTSDDGGTTKQYWTFDSSAWSTADSATPFETQLDWKSDGKQKSFECTTDLAQMRQKVKGTGQQLYIETKMDIHLSEEAYKTAIISASKDASGSVSSYTRLQYRAAIADSLTNLKSSSAVTSAEGQVHYYREDTGKSTISLTANDTSQLGINLDDLGSNGDGNIGATGVYDLSGLTSADDVISRTGAIQYKLTLWKRSDTDGVYKQVTDGVASYISVSSAELGNATLNGSAFEWQDAKATSGGFKTKDADSNKFKLSLSVKVDTTLNAHEYANYRLQLEAYAMPGGTSAEPVDTPVNATSQQGNSDYITYTFTRVKTSGISGSATASS